MKTVGKRTYYSLDEAAGFIDESVESVRSYIKNGSLPTNVIEKQTMVPAIPLHDFYYDHLLKTPQQKGKPSQTREALEKTTSKERSTNRIKDTTRPPKRSSTSAGSKSEKRVLENNLRRDKEVLERELRREREARKQDKSYAQYKIDRAEAELENLRRSYTAQSETSQEDLEEERSKKIESERRVEELQDRLKEAQRRLAIREDAVSNQSFYGRLRVGVKDVVGSLRDPASSEQTDVEVPRDLSTKLENLSLELDKEKTQRIETEQRARKLQSELNEERARRLAVEESLKDLEQSRDKTEEIEKALSSERAKLLQLEEEKRVLDEVRKLLEVRKTQPEQIEAIDSTVILEENPDGTNGKLVVQTHYGQWTFHPPFTLEEEEIELIRLVAGEDGITAEQIKHRTGRRRAVNDLDYLLDRLADKDMEPIKEVNDRYSFDHNILQDS